MLTGPKKTEYFALIAPKGKKALYLGYVNIPIAIGQALGAKITGAIYGTGGEKAILSLRYLAEHTDYAKERSGRITPWDGDVDHLADYVGVKRTAAAQTLVDYLHQDARAVSDLLWDTYHPYKVWFPLAAIGFASLVGILVFARMSKRWKDMDV
jgi:hypothetical protein